MSVPYLAIAGTHGWRPGTRGAWYQPDSPWTEHLRTLGFEPIGVRPFIWSTSLNGWQFWRRWTRDDGDHDDWICAAENLRDYLVPPLAPDRQSPPERTHIICHSHGIAPVLYAAAWYGLKIQTLTSICSPVRADMQPIARLARLNIRFWQHVHSDRSDNWQWLGELGDGHLGIQRAQPLADINHAMPKVGHSGILTDPTLFSVWAQLTDAIRQYDGVLACAVR